MDNEVAPILWYLLWAFVLTVLPLLMILADYRRRMKALEILKLYAEKGVEPPAPVAELLATEAKGSSARSPEKNSAFEARFGGFMGFTFVASMLGALLWWRMEAGGPQSLVYSLAAFAMFFAVGAVGFLFVALFKRN